LVLEVLQALVGQTAFFQPLHQLLVGVEQVQLLMQQLLAVLAVAAMMPLAVELEQREIRLLYHRLKVTLVEMSAQPDVVVEAGHLQLEQTVLEMLGVLVVMARHRLFLAHLLLMLAVVAVEVYLPPWRRAALEGVEMVEAILP
jgi:hypothetical protein